MYCTVLFIALLYTEGNGLDVAWQHTTLTRSICTSSSPTLINSTSKYTVRDFSLAFHWICLATQKGSTVKNKIVLHRTKFWRLRVDPLKKGIESQKLILFKNIAENSLVKPYFSSCCPGCERWRRLTLFFPHLLLNTCTNTHTSTHPHKRRI